MSALALKQTSLTNVFKLVLEASSLSYNRSEVLSSKKDIPYRQITGLFRDAERCYIVYGGEVVHFLHQGESPEYVAFMEQLVARLQSSR